MMGSTGVGRDGSTAQSTARDGSVRMVLELYCGSCAFAKYIYSQLEREAYQEGVGEVWYICVDCLSRKEIEQKYRKWDLASFLRKDRVVYLQQDLRQISPA